MSPALPRNHDRTPAAAPVFMLWQLCPLLLYGSSPWTDRCLLISLLSALSKQPCQNNCHRDWERGVFRSYKPPCYFGESTSYLGHSFIKPSDLLFLEWWNPAGWLYKGCTEQYVVLMSHIAIFPYFPEILSLQCLATLWDQSTTGKCGTKGKWKLHSFC